MKLRNKKTDEVIDFDSITDTCFGTKIQLQATHRHNKPIYIYNSLAELNDEWEDAMEKQADRDTARIAQKESEKRFSGEVYDELNKILKEENG